MNGPDPPPRSMYDVLDQNSAAIDEELLERIIDPRGPAAAPTRKRR